MKTRLFTLFALLIGVCSGVWAQTWWKVESATSTSADATYLNDGILTVKTVFAGTRNNSYKHNYTDGNNFGYNINIRVDAAPSTGTPTGTEKAGSTPLVITVKKNCSITFYYRRQANSSTFVSNDGKDMKLVDQAAPTTVIDAKSFLQDGTATDYDWCVKSYDLKSGKTYTLWARGTTVSLNGFSYVQEGTKTTKNTEKSNQHAYLDNAGTISGDGKILSFTDYPFTIEGENIQAGNTQYQFVVSGNNYTGVKFAGNNTYIIKPANGVTITDVKAYGSSNSASTTGIESGTSNSISLAARGAKNTPVTMSPLTLNTNGDGYYFFTITGGQSIIVCDVTYDRKENVDLTVSAAGYATLYYDKKLSIPTGVKAYSASVKDETTIALSEISDVIPANTGVIIEATAGKYNFVVTTADAPTISSNILTGTTTETTKAALGGTVYTLGQNGSGVVGLRSYTGTDIRAYSAYATSIAGARGFYTFEIENETTEISNLDIKEKAQNSIFNLSGQRIGQPTKGLYIVNGKKVILK